MSRVAGPIEPAPPPRVVEATDERTVSELVATLRRGGIVSFPTDTVYGLAASLRSPESLNRLYQSKHRSASKPIPVLLASMADLAQVALPVDDRTTAFLASSWPGPTTVVLPARPDAPEAVTGEGPTGDRTVAVRMPDLALALLVIREAGGALAVTSANISDQPPALNADEVARQLGDSVDLIVDGGPAPGGVASTVIRLASTGPVVLRQGAVPVTALTARWHAAARGHDG